MNPKIFLSSFLVLLSAIAACQSDDAFKGTELEGIPATDFTLTDQNGQPFTLSDQVGKVVVMFFGYTYCPDVCPATLSKWKQVQDALGDQTNEVKFVYITVHPERDTVEKLKAHLAVYSQDFVGLTGSKEDLLKVYNGYGVYREIDKISDSATGYLVSHTSRIFVFDRKGEWRLGIANDASVQDIVHDLKVLL